jgi:serine/threonine protein kinase
MDESERLKQRVGTTLRGKWTLERLLGVGGMAAVYAGVHKIGRRAAIKILHPDIAENKQIAQRFEQEAHAVNRFQHPGAVEILDVDVAEDGAPFLVMELLEGEPLADRVERGAVSPPELLRLTEELLDVLAAAHAHGIIHRDIKPDNLFVLRDGRLKVLDFGIAQMRKGAPKSVYTAIGTTIGTLTYMSPEQVAGKEIDGRADIFAVGCTMFRIVAGRSTHQGDTDLELMVKMATEPAPPLASCARIAGGASPELCMVVDRALAFERERRYPDARTMQEDVRALRQGYPPPYASSRLAAGDLPNPPPSPASRSYPGVSATRVRSEPMVDSGRVYAPTSVGTPPSVGGSGAWGPQAGASMGAYGTAAVAAVSVGSATAMRYGLTMPGRPMATSEPSLATATPAPGAPPRSISMAEDRRAKDKRIAWLLIGGMFVVFAGALGLWLTFRSADGDDLAAAAPSRGGPGAADSSSPSGANREPRGKGPKRGGKKARGAPTVIVIPISPSGEPMQGHYGDEDE